jgi:hypothetical protein
MDARTQAVRDLINTLYEAHVRLQELNIERATITVTLPSVGTFCVVFDALREACPTDTGLQRSIADSDLRHGVELFDGAARVVLDPKVLRELEERIWKGL